MRAALLLAAGLLAPGARAAAGPLDLALSSALRRATTQLKEKGYPPAYFVSLTAIDVDSWEQRCVMGSPVFTGGYRQRLILPDVRVGDYSFDSHPLVARTDSQAFSAPYADDEFALRYVLWRHLDGAYKAAAAGYLRKEALRVLRGKTDYDADDLSREPPRVHRQGRPPSPWRTEALSALCSAGGKVFRARPGLLSAEVSVRLRRQWSRLRDSEGSAVDFGRDVAQVDLEASERSPDGTTLSASRKFLAASPRGLPGIEQVKSAARRMLGELSDLRLARTTSPFSAPALLDPSVSAAVVFSAGLRLSGEALRNPEGARTFGGELGKAVLPPEFSLMDDPTRAEFNGKPLAGHYEFDDQGLPPRRVDLIEGGVLKDALLSRYLIVGREHSNGHGRAFAGDAPRGLPGSLFFSSSKPFSQEALLERLRRLCRRLGKPYGLWVRGLRSVSQQQNASGQASVRVLAARVELVDARTGELTLVRDLDLVGTPLALLGNILAAGRDQRATDMMYGAPISVVSPSLLIADAELQRSESVPEKGPILPPPARGGASGERGIPFVPRLAFVQVQRYVIHGLGRLPPPVVAGGIEDSRRRLNGPDAVLDFKVRAPSLKALGEALRRLDAAVERLAAGRPVDKKVLVPTMPQPLYRARFGSGWPE
ncbi:MAG: hypothetical protein KGO96_00265 [Elusimicrobia bacterium]|nr:hypothetical protein [Elusimicrobiota bacterium]MDE2424327.1 hypothetical protein [Elusimicrobiota bacterium]